MNTSLIQTVRIKVSAYLINRNYALLWGGQAISNVGDIVFDITLVLWIATVIAYKESWAPLASSGVLLVTLLPTFIIGPIAGVFVDRWDKRRTMMCMDAIRAILILLLLLATGLVPLPFIPGGKLTNYEQIIFIYVITFLATVCAQFFNPSRFAIISDVVNPEERAHASALGQLTSNMALVIGPSIAAPLLFSVGVQWALILDALSFVVSFLAIFSVRLPQTIKLEEQVAQSNFWREMITGLRFFRQNRLLVTLLISVGIVSFGIGALNALDIYFVITDLHISGNFYGILATVFGMGSIVGALLSSTIIKRLGAIRSFWFGLLAAGILILIFARQTNFISALVFYFLLSMPVVVVNTVVGPLILGAIPRNLLGRVISIFTPAMSLITIFSIAFSGYLASKVLNNFHVTLGIFTFGSIDTIFTGTGLLTCLGGMYACVALRKLASKNDEKA